MSLPVDESVFKVLDWAWGVIVMLVGYIWKSQSDKISALKEDVDKHNTALKDEQIIQRSHIAKIFDKMEESERRSADRHVELLTAIHTGLAGKQDKD
jgi:hypothetical protein